MKRVPLVLGIIVLGVSAWAVEQVPFTNVRIDDSFWSPRLQTNRKVTIPYNFQKCQETGRISNFAKAGGLMEGNFEGIYFNDSDLYKVIEGAAYSLQNHPDPELEKYVDGVIDQIAAAQWEDGYLYTFYSLPKKQPEKRWTDTRSMHELYCAGHFFEGAAAYYQATGKRKILDVAIRLADYIDSVFGPGRKYDIPGHEEIEIGLVKLYRVTEDEKYLKLAKFFLDQRGDSTHRALYGEYCQDHMPVVRQSRAVGHSVRAGYLYCGMADVAALTGDRNYVAAIDRIWHDVVDGKTYLTGGIGARHGGEAFGESYELPNASAYNETCAAIANAMWNHRLFLLHGDAQYIDVLERIIYNGFLSGISLEGNRFFYPNPLASDGGYERSAWFGCSCCPVNVVRFIPSIPGYIYGVKGDTIYVNLFIGGQAEIKTDGGTVKLEQKTGYPWDGNVRIQVTAQGEKELTIAVRVPGWAQGVPMPGDLYRYLDSQTEPVKVTLNGTRLPIKLEKGYLAIRRTWTDGDRIEINLPMPIRRVLAHPSVRDDLGKTALERGPIVYCLEEADNGPRLDHILLEDKAEFAATLRPDLLGGIVTLYGNAASYSHEEGGTLNRKSMTITAIPYYAWAHRGAGAMRVWLARTESAVIPLPAPTIAGLSKVSASHTWELDTAKAVNDQREPKNSGDHEIPRHTFWDHRGSKEWIQYDFAGPAEVSEVSVYWFDDTGRGECRVPRSWRLLYRRDGQWKPVTGMDGYSVEKDRYNHVRFDPVKTDGLRIELTLQDGYSGGVLEWKVQ
ncbi:MAG: glycoside hydrolase family 127 protein [Sedimentisphaerales bacterium]|nr:glycoside hydrolase family 127 protein [Sedimentisphaerales bacterium]